MREQVAVHVEEAYPEQAQHPLVRARGHGVDAARLDVDGERAGLLDRVDHEQHVPIPAEPPDGVHVGAVAARELHRAHRHQPRPRADGILDRLGRHHPVHRPDLAQPDAAIREMLPGVDVGRVLDGAGHRHFVSGAPVQPFRHHRQTVGRASDERDLLGRGADERCGPRPGLCGARPPLPGGHVALGDVVFEPGVDRRAHAGRARRHRGAVEIGTAFAGRECVTVPEAQGRHDGSSRGTPPTERRRGCTVYGVVRVGAKDAAGPARIPGVQRSIVAGGRGGLVPAPGSLYNHVPPRARSSVG